jgi:hypothetical protein
LNKLDRCCGCSLVLNHDDNEGQGGETTKRGGHIMGGFLDALHEHDGGKVASHNDDDEDPVAEDHRLE